MRARFLRGGDHLAVQRLALAVEDAAEAGDIGVDGGGKQRRHLRQEAQMPAELFAIPVGQGRAVDPHLAAVGALRTGQHTQQRRLAGTARADQRDDLPRLHGEAYVGQDRPIAARRDNVQPTHLDPSGGGGQRGGRAVGAGAAAKRVQRAPCAACGGQRLDRTQYLFDRLDRPAQQQRGGEDRAARNILSHRQPCAQRQRQRLQQLAQEFGDRQELARGAR